MKEIVTRCQQHVVPCYHRSYVWGEQQWDAVWTPVVELGKSEVSLSSHFFGIMLTQTGSLGDVDKILLLDGQQRIMTVFIFISLLRNLEKANGRADAAAEIHDIFLVNRFVRKQEDAMKIVPAEDDQEAFSHLILGRDRIDGNRIFEAYDYFEKKIKNSGIPLSRIKYAILNFKVVDIILEKGDDVEKIWRSYQGV